MKVALGKSETRSVGTRCWGGEPKCFKITEILERRPCWWQSGDTARRPAGFAEEKKGGEKRLTRSLIARRCFRCVLDDGRFQGHARKGGGK